ncbi:MAG: uridylate kinase, partial [Gemmatimonadota bacterium]|nr:uridylate kinase [Gemmatimonadota bacterium]
MTPVSPLRAIKVGGSLAGITGALPRAGQVLAQAAARQPTVVLPGGGPFADAVRAFDQSHGLSDDAAHWMAILAMDQYAHVLADHVPGSRLVRSLPQIRAAHEAGAVPILAPARWL